jgi:hypothetical protein
VAPYLRSGQLVALLTDWHGELTRDVRNIYAVYPHAAHVAPAVRAFVDFLRRFIGLPPYWDTGRDPDMDGLADDAPPVRQPRRQRTAAAAGVEKT